MTSQLPEGRLFHPEDGPRILVTGPDVFAQKSASVTAESRPALRIELMTAPASPTRPSTLPTPDSIESILIVRLSALGDVIHCLPALAALRELYPDARIDWVVESLGASVLEGHPDLNEVVRLPRKEWSRRMKRLQEWPRILDEVSRTRSRLRTARYDLVIDFQGNLRSRAVALTAAGRYRVGHHPTELKEYGWLVPGNSPRSAAGRVHRVEKNLHIVRSLGWHGETPLGRLPDVTPERHHIENELGDDEERRVLLHPFASAFGRFKEWPHARYAELAQNLAEDGHRVLISWGPGDQQRAQEIVDRSAGACELAPATPSMRHLIALLQSCDLLVAADTGPLHLAATSGVPVVALFGPKDPALYGPWSHRRDVLRSDVPCSPCTLRRCDHAICMQTIGVERVQRFVDQRLSGRGSAKPVGT